jgi:hypothetical protein
MLALWSVAELAAPVLVRVFSTFVRTAEKTAVRWSRILVSVVSAWPMGKAKNSTRLQYLLRAAMRGGGEYFRFFLDLNVAAEVPTKADLYDDEGALFYVERSRV